VDIVEIQRFERMLERCDDAQLETIFSPAELVYCRTKENPTLSLAGRLAVKESCMKLFPRETALKEIDFSDFEVVVDAYGAPRLRDTRKLTDLLKRNGWTEMAVSLSHTASFACGMAIGR
jgi:holo-[acyl-carrier protein] synthase